MLADRESKAVAWPGKSEFVTGEDMSAMGQLRWFPQIYSHGGVVREHGLVHQLEFLERIGLEHLAGGCILQLASTKQCMGDVSLTASKNLESTQNEGDTNRVRHVVPVNNRRTDDEQTGGDVKAVQRRTKEVLL
jgi:hypothetical protein